MSIVSLGYDFSANKPSLPVVGSNFGGSGVYANYYLIATIPVSTARDCVTVQNTSGAQVAVVLDDGTAAYGAAPNNATVFALAGGASAGSQGGGWSSTTFKGRVQIYSASATAQVCASED